jgi:hypothetical protein
MACVGWLWVKREERLSRWKGLWRAYCVYVSNSRTSGLFRRVANGHYCCTPWWVSRPFYHMCSSTVLKPKTKLWQKHRWMLRAPPYISCKRNCSRSTVPALTVMCQWRFQNCFFKSLAKMSGIVMVVLHWIGKLCCGDVVVKNQGKYTKRH